MLENGGTGTVFRIHYGNGVRIEVSSVRTRWQAAWEVNLQPSSMWVRGDAASAFGSASIGVRPRLEGSVVLVQLRRRRWRQGWYPVQVVR